MIDDQNYHNIDEEGYIHCMKKILVSSVFRGEDSDQISFSSNLL